MEILIKILNWLVKINNGIFAGFDSLIENLSMPEWISDAVIDSVHMLLFLFLTFLLIEFIESCYSPKMKNISKFTKFTGPLFGSLLAVFPQCGFSVVAAGLYAKRFISLGTLLAIFISTSDEAIPVLLANPESISLVLPIIGTKLIIAIAAGYIIDFIFKQKLSDEFHKLEETENHDVGCCNHNVTHVSKKDLILHPIIHTANIFMFILPVTLFINAIFNFYPGILSETDSANIIQIIQMSLIGLIPNCAASVFITLLYAKGAISFAAVTAGLCTSAGLGLIVLFKYNKNLKDSFRVLLLLLGIGILSGFLINVLLT